MKLMKNLCQKQVNNRQWFIGHFNQIYRNKEYFASNTPNALIIIDCFTIYSIGCCAGCRVISRIHIGTLFKLWDIGFKYHGFPVVEYSKHNGIHQLNYIYKNQLLTKIFKYNEKPMFNNTLCMTLQNLRNSNNVCDGYKTIAELRYSI